MPKTALIIGGAGTGKTTHLLNLMEKVLASGIADPRLIGFVSFTRAARYEAARRAADRFNMKPTELEQDGWFRTLHSCCYKLLGVGKELLAGSKEDREWLQQSLDAEVQSAGGDNDGSEPFSGRTDAEIALSLWGAARNRLEPLETTWERADRCDERTPDLSFCRDIIGRYEQAKRIDGRLDFTDLLGRYAGWRFTTDGCHEVAPDGDVPDVPVWFIDEAQDNSALTDAVARRLTSTARYCYLVGDAFQAIYGFSGADQRLFQNWNHTKRRILDKSFRCPPSVLELGEDILLDCADYWDRKIAPADHHGEIETTDFRGAWAGDIHPGEPWLLLARTNFQASRIGRMLNEHSVPWVTPKGGSRWNAPAKRGAIVALTTLASGYPITVSEWKGILKHAPSRSSGSELLARGTKKRWQEFSGNESDLQNLAGLAEWGAADAFQNAVSSGAWMHWIDDAEDFVDAIRRWGMEVVENPQVVVSTIHGAKGMEADNVLLLTTTSHQVARSAEDDDGADAERRIAYVAVTRARRRLIVARERTQFAMDIPV